MVTIISRNAEETQALGESWGREAQPGWLIGLTGDLGAGKTQLVKGLARGLQIPEPVLSPTFALVQLFTTGRLPLVHLDLYRLDTMEQILACGLDQYVLEPSGLVVIEWVERWQPSLRLSRPGGVIYREVKLQCESESERRIDYEDFGP
jgi:tRNA threonylcarbamoyladenosine biosynthesis protein TsaE